MCAAMSRGQEQKLIREAARGDRDAAGMLVKAHQNGLFAYMVRLTGRNDVAEDVVQEAFVRALTNLDRFDSRFRFSTWIFTIARRLYLNYCERKRPALDTDLCQQSTRAEPGPSQLVESKDANAKDREEINQALQELPSVQRQIIVLFHQQDWAIWQIAEHLDLPEGTIKSHLHRGRLKLRVLLSKLRAEREEAARLKREAMNQEAWS